MSAASIKQDLLNYIHHLTLYEYVAFGWVVFFFITLLIFSIIIANKKPLLATILIVFNFSLLILSPILIKILMNNTIKKSEVKILNQEHLKFSKSIIVQGEVINKGKIDFKECEIKGRIYKISSNSLKNFLYKLKPLKKKKIILKKRLPKKASLEFRLVFNNFVYPKNDFNVTVNAECY